MSEKPIPITIASLRGGYNDTDPVHALPPDECALAQNVEFFASMLGERRAGCDPIDVTTAGFGGSAMITVSAPSSATWGIIELTLAPTGIIAFDNSAVGGINTTTNTFTAAYAVGASANYLIVAVLGDATSDLVTGVTYNGTSMSQLSKLNTTIGWIYVYGLAAPTTGSHNVVVSASANCTNLGFLASSYSGVTSSEPDASTTGIFTGTSSATTGITPTVKNCWAIQFSLCSQGQPTAIQGGVPRSFSTVTIGTPPTLTWTGTTSGSQNFNVNANPLVFGPGTYTISVSGSFPMTFKGAASGAGGGSGVGDTLGDIWGGSGGGSGAVTKGTSATLLAGKSYTLVVGAGGATDSNGQDTTFTNMTDSSVIVDLGGGAKGQYGLGGPFLAGGAGGSVVVGSNPVIGVAGGATTDGIGDAGVSNTVFGAAGGGAGGAAGAGWAGGNGGSGTTTGGTGGASAVSGTDSSGKGGQHIGSSGVAPGGGGGGGGGVLFGVAGESTFGAGGGGGGGGGTNGFGNPVGGVGGDGIAIIYLQSGVAVNAITLADTASPVVAQTGITHLSEWFPLNDTANSELWAVAAAPNDSTPAKMTRLSPVQSGSEVWYPVTPIDPIVTVTPDVYQIQSQPLDGLLFWAYTSGIDRMHVWEPGSQILRRTGLAEPKAAPTVANGGGAGSYAATQRYYRTRWVRQINGVTAVRSEPSDSIAFTPDGAHANATVTNSATIGENETHWEVEVSLDNATFYRLATVAVATTTYADSAATTSYNTNPQSDAIGAYLLQPAAKFVGTDDDHLLLAGHTFDPARMSTIWWSPIGGDPGVGNGERQPIVDTGGTDIVTQLVLDNYVGGPITGIASGLIRPTAYALSAPTTAWFVFKWQRIYMVTSTGEDTQAYDAICLTSTRGAIQGSIFKGFDDTGQPCVYFLDPIEGPSRITLDGGVQTLRGLKGTWKQINLNASSVIACGCYYPYKRQAIWWVSLNGSNTPNTRIKYQIYDQTQLGSNGPRWSLDTGKIATAVCTCIHTEYVSDNGNTTLSLRPVIGLQGPDFIQRCDVNITDNGSSYNAAIVTAPISVGRYTQKFGIRAGTVVSTANSNANFIIRLIRDFGEETSNAIQVSSTTDLNTVVDAISPLDALRLSQARVVQIKISDN